jgi:hypothetical protein
MGSVVFHKLARNLRTTLAGAKALIDEVEPLGPEDDKSCHPLQSHHAIGCKVLLAPSREDF